MPLDAVSHLDPCSETVMHAFDHVGPSVVHVTCTQEDGTPTGKARACSSHPMATC